MTGDHSRIICELDCGCRFDAEDVFRNQPLTRGRYCVDGEHRMAPPVVPVGAVVDQHSPAERIFAIAKPNDQSLLVIFDKGTLELMIDEARRIHDVIGAALQIYDNQHPVQREAAADADQAGR